MFAGNRSLLVVGIVSVVNSLGYGIIIPVLYSYSLRYGLNDFQNGLLFATFSLFQFLAAPIIGRLSDKYGRRPLLLVSLFGTTLSFLMMAGAQSAVYLFLARALDGITAGNLPVAQAVISDTTEMKDRARGFGIMGAAFGFGFIFGPAISALTVGYSSRLPFLIAALISGLSVLLTYLFLPETNKHLGEVKKSKIFDFGRLFRAAFEGVAGTTLLVIFCYYLAFSSFIYAFQPFSVKVLGLSPREISGVFTLFGLVGLFTQVWLLPRVLKKSSLERIYPISLLAMTVCFVLYSLSQNLWSFVIVSIFLALFNALAQPLAQTLLSAEADAKSQGSVLGLGASYMGLGQILGPLLAGAVAVFSVRYPFFLGALFVFVSFLLARRIFRTKVQPESAF